HREYSAWLFVCAPRGAPVSGPSPGMSEQEPKHTGATVPAAARAASQRAGGPSPRAARSPQTPGEADGSPSPGLLPPPSLPKGGGAIAGIGEKLSTNAATGTGSLSVPVTT